MNQMLTIRYLFLIFIVVILVSCSKDGGLNNSSGENGQGGSLARFTIAGDYLYTVDNTNLKAFSLEKPESPELKDQLNIGFGIETIFPLGNKLFIGSQNGMYLYDISNPILPFQMSYFQHIYSCDPVVSDGEYAYVTLSSNSRCGNITNELQIIDIKDSYKPVLKNTVKLENPGGLGVDNNKLFVCDNGLKVFDITDILNIKLISKFDINAKDVIPVRGVLFVIGDDGFYQYRYDGVQLILLSHIATSSI